MVFCHSIVFGVFCVYKVVRYSCAENPDFVCDITIKKIFVDMYNCCLEFTNFCEFLKDIPEDWLFPLSVFRITVLDTLSFGMSGLSKANVVVTILIATRRGRRKSD